jgi:hypothetical protein
VIASVIVSAVIRLVAVATRASKVSELALVELDKTKQLI